MLSITFWKTDYPHITKTENSIKTHICILKVYLFFACHLLRMDPYISKWKILLKVTLKLPRL